MAELIWDGKYDPHGNKRAPVRIELPFQTVETVNESVQERQRTLELSSSGHDPEWRNRLIWGDKKYVLPSLLPEFAGKVDLIYIDPPFDTGADFSFTTNIPGSEDLLEKEASVLEQKAYRDTWGKGLGSYLPWFYDTAALLRELLSDSGTLYVHLDWHVGHYAKLVLDEIFGPEMFRNDITWWYRKWSRGNKQFLRNHDSLLFYAVSDSQTFNIQRVPLAESTIKRFGGKRQEFADEARTRKIVSDEESQGAFMPDVWDINSIPAHSSEKIGYATQKPEALLDRIIKASSNEGDLVLDCFCGSGTTAAVAEKLNRRWIACDLGRFAIHTTRKRLLGIPGLKPFVVQNLGKYERQQCLDVMTFQTMLLPLTPDDPNNKTFRYEGHDIITLQKIVERDYKVPEPQTAQELIGYYARRIAEAVKLPSQFAALAPKIREFFENKAFGRWVDLSDMVTVRAMSTQVASYVCIQEFSRVLKQLSIADQAPELVVPARMLSTCPPFPWSRKVYEANHCVFNMVPCDNDFEKSFARFLDNADDISAFAKLPQPFGFSIDYVDLGMNLRSYYPDFVALDSSGQHWLIETKGMESSEVSQKDAAAANWCENASTLTKIPWRYVKVPQKGFEVLQPKHFADLAALAPDPLLWA
jgi:DNA modification methylase